MVGGESYPQDISKSAEIFNLKSKGSCRIGDLKVGGHVVGVDTWTLCHNMLCGKTSCEKFDGILSFRKLPVRLVRRRGYHLCWGLQSGSVEHSHWSRSIGYCALIG